MRLHTRWATITHRRLAGNSGGSLDFLRAGRLRYYKMIVRVKYKTAPGEQFVIRKEVYRLMQEAFHEHGIEFAHRNDTVYIPPEESHEAPTGESGDAAAQTGGAQTGGIDKTKLEAAAAAAGAAAQAEEEKQKPQG